MKKRLLSAALALAMVLTLLPMSVFAAPSAPGVKDGDQVLYVNGTDYQKPMDDSGNNFIQNAWAYSYKDNNKTYWATVSDGIVEGTSASGKWHANTVKSDGSSYNSFTIVGSSASVDATNLTTLSVNVFGGALTISGNTDKLTGVTITDTKFTQGWTTSRGSVSSGISRNVSGNNASGMKLSVTGADAGAISLTGGSNSVTLTEAKAGAITLNGGPSNNARQSLDTNPERTAPYQGSQIDGAITITGNNSSVNLKGTNAGSNTLTVNSSGGTVMVDNGSKVGVITVTNLNQTATSSPATVTISDGEAGGIKYAKGSATGDSTFTVNANGDVTGDISTTNGTVSIHSADVTGKIEVKQGALTIDGSNGTVTGGLDLAATGKTTLNFSGTGYTVGNITANNNGSSYLTIGGNWPATRNNTFGSLTLDTYAGGGIKGGTFGFEATTTAHTAYFSGLQFMRKVVGGVNDGKWAYYGPKELSDAIADAGAAAKTKDTIKVMGYNGASGSAKMKYVSFFNTSIDASLGSETAAVALLGYGVSTGIYLPDKINNTAVSSWTDNNTAKIYYVNELLSLNELADQDALNLVLQGGGSASVTRLTNVTTTGTNKDITATLNNNQITLSGAVGPETTVNIALHFETDLRRSDGTNYGYAVGFDAYVTYVTADKTATISTFGMTPPPQGVQVNSTNIVVGTNTYTLNVSGLAKPAGNLKVAGIDSVEAQTYDNTTQSTTKKTLDGKRIVAAVNSSMGNVSKQQLIDQITGDNSSFDWTNSPALRQVVNAAQATITNTSQVDNWKTAAQRAAWNQLNRGKTPNATDLGTTKYDDVVLEPYLALTVTGTYNSSGTMTATLVPSYRVIVVTTDADYAKACAGKSGFTAEGYYIAQQGRALGTPAEDLTQNLGIAYAATLQLGDSMPDGFNTGYAHQDDTYVYAVGKDTNKKMTITRAGKTGLGTVTFNKTAPTVTMERYKGSAYEDLGYSFDNLQAAVDVTVPTFDYQEDRITVWPAYSGSGVINVTGVARKFYVQTLGNTAVTPANSNFAVQVDSTGHGYVVQLQQSVAPVGGNITIASATGGYASVSSNPATAGQTVTITLTPNAGYTSTGVTVRTSAGGAVSVTGSGNTYTFTMPSGAVTVTPSFRGQQVVQTNATVTVNSTNSGTAVTSAGNNQVAAGSTVTVTTRPNSGYRTMGLYVNGANASRTGTNSFSFVVPSNTSNVVVTPRFDVDNGTVFEDVWSSEYYSAPVAWAVGKQITNGRSTYQFDPTGGCTREDMVTFLYRAAGQPAVGNVNNPFLDVQPGTYYYNAVMWAVSKGITNGVTANQFGVGQYVTRAQSVTFLYRYENSPAASTNSGFYDVNRNEYYANAVSWANANGVTNGTTTTTFSPNDYCQRCQIVTFMYRDMTGNRA